MGLANPRRDQAGFALPELMFAVGIMMVLSGAAISLMKNAFSVSVVTTEMSDAQESLRIAQEYINRDLLVAGDGMKGLNNICLPATFVNTYLTKSTINSPCGTGLVSLPLVQSDDNVPANTVVTGMNPLMKVRSSPSLTDRITILALDRSFTPVALPANAIVPSGANVSVSAADINRFNVGEIYFITTSAGATFGTVTGKNVSSRNILFDDSDTYGLNAPGNGGPINTITEAGTLPASIMRMRVVNYFVNENGLLIRRVFGVGGGVGFTDSVIAEHVRDLQFRYLLNLYDENNDLDSTTADDNNVFLMQPVAQPANADQQVAVRQVEVTVTTETAHPVVGRQRPTVTMTTISGVRNPQFNEAPQP